MRDRSKQLLVINTGKKPSKLPSQSGNTHIIGGGGLPVNMSDYLLKSIWDKVFELKTDSQGTDYIFSKLPVVTQYGITMYSGDGVNIPSLASGLPFDGRTIWYNPDTNQIEVIGGTGGGSGEGVSNFWDLSGIPSWITISKPKYSYSEIEGTPDLSVFATQNWIINQGYASAEELKKYIPISGYTEVSGEKNFTGGLKVNGSPIYYDTEEKYWKLEGDLLVTGGVTMYGVDSADIPSLINSLPVATTKEKGVAYFDPDFFSVSSDGKVSFIGETGGGLDIVSLQNYLTQNSYLNVTEGDNRYLKFSGGTLTDTLTINRSTYPHIVLNSTADNGDSCVRFGLKNIIKGYVGYSSALGVYLQNSTTNKKLSLFDDGSLSYGGSTIWHSNNDGADSGLDADMLDGRHSSGFAIYEGIIGANNSSGAALIGYTYTTQEHGGLYVGGFINFGVKGYFCQLNGNVSHNSLAYRFYNTDHGKFSDWRQIAFTDSNVASATKLQTVRTIWGQSFDGTGDIEGGLVIKNDSAIYIKDASGTNRRMLQLNAFNTNLIANSTYDTVLYGKSCYLAYGTSASYGIILNSSGNVGIGTTTPAYKLDINGVMRSIALKTGSICIECDSLGETSNRGGEINRYGGALHLQFDTPYNITMCYGGGNVGIGTTSPSSKLDVEGTAKAKSLMSGNIRIECDNNGVLGQRGSEINNYNNHLYLNHNSSKNVIIATGGGYVGIGTSSPSHKLHVVGNTYLNGDVFADELNTFDVLPRTSNAYSCGNSSLRWYQVYGNIGDFSGAVNMGSTLNVTGMTTMTNATITGYLRLKDTTNYGRTIYFGDGELCYLEEASDDVLTIYANAGIKLNTSSTSYNVSINTNLLVSGGITMYSQRSLKNIQDERGLSLDELGAIKPIRYTWKDNRDNRLHIGGIADDIQQVLPEVVYKTNDGVLTMDYGNAAFAIASSLINPVIDHEKRIAMLEEENKELRNEIERLKSA